MVLRALGALWSGCGDGLFAAIGDGGAGEAGVVGVLRAGSLYLPVAAALLLVFLRRPRKPQWAGILLACAWNASALLALNVVAQRVGWWWFGVHGGLFFGMPLELYLGWIVLWGVVPELAFPREPLAVV